jgi:uncharacterized membrane protein
MRKLIAFFLASFFVLFSSSIFAQDILETVITPSKQNRQVIDLWNDRQSVWNTLFRWWVTVIDGKLVEVQPVYIRVTKSILRLTLAIWITMGIIIWVKYIYTQWNETEQKKLQWYLRNIVYWILIALGSLVIVEIILSVTRSSIAL